MERTKRYAVVVGAIALTGMALVAGINAAVDPHALWSRVHGTVTRLGALEGGGRLFKSERLTEGNWQALIFGSSRCLRGINPANPAFAGMRTFNACLSGTNMAEVARVIAFAQAHNPNLKRVVIALDFEMFARQRETAGDYASTQMAGKSKLDIVLDYLLSLDTLELSADTLLNNMIGYKTDLRDSGFEDWTVFKQHGTTRGHFDAMLRLNYLVDGDNYGAFHYAPHRAERLRRAIVALHAAGVDVRLYIPPIHARQMEAILDLGLPYADWLRTMAGVAHDTGTPLVDFSGYNTITTEAIPPAGSKAPMRWYWESSHFRREVGDMILGVLYGNRRPETPTDFGRVLSPQAVEVDIAALNSGHANYAITAPLEAQTVADFVKQTEARRQFLRRLHGPSQL